MMTNKICFIGFFPDYETYFFQEVSIENMSAEVFNPLDITNKLSYFKKLPRFMRNIWNKKLLADFISKQPNAHFVFNEHRLLLQGVCQYLKHAKHMKFKGYLLLRNPVEDNIKIKPHLAVLQKHGVNILTFDKADSKKHGYRQYPQFASVIPSLQAVNTACDFSFIGRDKGRAEQLHSLQKRLQKAGYQALFDIRKPVDGNLTYLQYLEKSLQAKCMVEILQTGQSGMTLRAIEALLYGRKLLTNNQSIINEPFYHEDNIMVFDGSSIDLVTLKRFMNKPLYKIDDGIKNRYTTNTIVKNILEQQRIK